MKATVSALSLAICLAACVTNSADGDLRASADSPEVVADLAGADAGPAPTAADAMAFVARAEKELGEFSLISAKAQWVNATYITDDTDALAAHFGTIGTEMGVKFASEAARFNDVAGLDYDTRRKLDILRGGLTLAAPQTPGAAAGRTIRRRIDRSRIPRVRPMSTKSSGTRLVLSVISSTCWKNVPIQMITNFCVSSVPAHRIVSGTNATTGM